MAVPSSDAVPGDVVVLDTGDLIPGDCLVLTAEELLVLGAITAAYVLMTEVAKTRFYRRQGAG